MPELLDAFRQVAEASAFAGGPFVSRFETEFAAYCGTQFAIGMGSGTDALWLSLLVALGYLVYKLVEWKNFQLGMAPLVIALGPGFEAGVDVHCVVETKRGHNLGRVIYRGSAAPNTGIPGVIGGESEKRLVRSPGEGFFTSDVKIGDIVSEGQILGRVADLPVRARIAGLVRGQIHPSVRVVRGMKIGDIDPRIEQGNWNTISDKALSIAGGVLEAVVAAIPLS